MMITLPTANGDVYVEADRILGHEARLMSNRVTVMLVGGIRAETTLTEEEYLALVPE